MTMSRSFPSPDRPAARVQGVAAAAAALVSGLVAHARWRLAGRPQPIFNNGGGGGRGDGPPDMEEMWRDFNRRLSGLFGGKGGGQRPGGPPTGNSPPDMRNAGIGIGLIAGVVVLIWAGSGFFVVQESQQGVVTSFGKYERLAGAGFNWRFPYPFQDHEIVNFTQVRTVEIGGSDVSQATGLRDSSMLTKDQNIIDIRFSVQYRVMDSRAYLYENLSPEAAVAQAAQSAVREIVGRSDLDSVLFEKREAIAADLKKSVGDQLKLLNTGITVSDVNVNSVRAPEPVQAAFDDVDRAKADRERLKNEGESYANSVIPGAKGDASKIKEEAQAYRATIIGEAEGDAQRFSQLVAEYQKAPSVTRDRLYLDAMRTVYGNVTKVLIDTRSNSNMLYLPIDKLMAGQQPAAPAQPALSTTTPESPPAAGASLDSRARDAGRSRDRDVR